MGTISLIPDGTNGSVSMSEDGTTGTVTKAPFDGVTLILGPAWIPPIVPTLWTIVTAADLSTYSVGNDIRNSAGVKFLVAGDVKNSAGTDFTIFT
jgi:hypothetical protein|tara:strand:- start:4988 stop:5272 length:285 start_codon:yes stop_codon:yes gene_type:complete